MKKRVLKHKNRGEVEQYYKLLKRYGDFDYSDHEVIDGWFCSFKVKVKYSEFCRRYKKMIARVHNKKFRSSSKAFKYDEVQALRESMKGVVL